MADRTVENSSEEVPEIPEMLENVLLFALDEAKEKMEEGAELVPFTTLVVKENLFIESHPGDSSEECYNLAQHTVEGARGADAYAFCYDGYVETDDGTKDVVIAEGGVPGAEDCYAVGYFYTVDDEGGYIFEEEAAYIGEAPNFMAKLKSGVDYGEDEIDEKNGTVLASTGDKAGSTSNTSSTTTATRSGKVAVKNGANIDGAAATAATKIEKLGYTTETGNASSSFSTTVVVYTNDSQKEAAEEIVKQIGNGVATKNDGRYTFSTDFLVVIGSDWK